ncbi:hypothetical protein [Mycolicibacterium porcinum]|uniref:RiboL-PSP-HEPN domain-containing protein n=1 Tax=Mycolicibacterium porcinum TaxID=39693 RepID=A0AAW5T282_9MYCO|nr:hypothetical protein [Mycolicibacterium porcinum]MCV7388369.1 hypothetical protein [Mycolicibacterium porcinum]
MNDIGKRDPIENEVDFARIADRIAEAIFVTRVESGALRIGDRPVEEIFAEFTSWARNWAHTPPPHPDKEDVRLITDHRQELLSQASGHAATGEHQTALVLYATWIEHELNAVLSRAFERKDVSDENIRALLRAVNLDPKITALWEVADIPPIETELVRSIRRIAALRNEFVHYKWTAAPVDPPGSGSKDRYAVAVEECEATCAALTKLTRSFLWDGRHEEVLTAFRGPWSTVQQDVDGSPSD